jgi:hypothetical protein
MPFHTTTLFHICGNIIDGNQYENLVWPEMFFCTKPIPYWQQPKTWIVYCEALQTHLMNAVPRNPRVSAKLHVKLVNMTHQSSQSCWHICKQYIKCYPYATAGVNSKEWKRVNWYHICIWKLTYCPINVLCSCAHLKNSNPPVSCIYFSLTTLALNFQITTRKEGKTWSNGMGGNLLIWRLGCINWR